MRRYNIVSRIFVILTVITVTLAAPVLVQEKHQAWLDVAHVPEDVITVLRKRILDEDLDMLWDGWWHYVNVLGEPAPPPIVPLPNLAEVHVHVPELHVHVPEVHVPPELMELDDDAPPVSPEGSTESEDRHTPPSSLGSSKESDPDHGSTNSNVPSAESQSENVDAAEMELRSAVDPGP